MSLLPVHTATLARPSPLAVPDEAVAGADEWAPSPTAAGEEGEVEDAPDADAGSEAGSQPQPSGGVCCGSVCVVFDDAFDACVLGRVLWLLRAAAAATLLHAAVLALASSSLGSASSAADAVLRASDVVFLDVLRLAFVLLGFGAAYLDLISPASVFSEIAHALVLGLVVDNLVGAALACLACSLDALATDAFSPPAVGATLLEAALHTHLGFAFWAPRGGNLNPLMWVHYSLLALAALATRVTVPFDDSAPARAETVRRVLLGAAAVALATHAAYPAAAAHGFWFYSLATTPVLHLGEAAVGVLLALAAVLDTERAQALARAWRPAERPCLLLVLACWAFELGRPWALPPWPAPAACARFEFLAPCMGPGLLAVPRVWCLAASALAAVVRPAPGCADTDDDDTTGDVEARARATHKTVRLACAVAELAPCAALAWPLLATLKMIVRVAGVPGALADNSCALVLAPVAVAGALRVYARHARTQLALRLAHGGSHLAACLHFSRRRLCGV